MRPKAGASEKAIVYGDYEEYCPAEVLRYTDVEKPAVCDDEVLVRVRAASINFGDRAVMHGSPGILRLAFGLLHPRAWYRLSRNS